MTRLSAGVFALFSTIASATIYDIDLSPAGGTALDLGANPYNGDHGIGLSTLNETSPLAGSPGEGDEINNGILYDDVTNVLTFDIGYGSNHGFPDINGGLQGAGIHGPSSVQFPNSNVSVNPALHSIFLDHIPFPPLLFVGTGTFTGAVMLSDQQELDLFDNELYVNINSGTRPNGEIQGQLIPVAIIPLPAALWLAVAPLLGLAGFCRGKR